MTVCYIISFLISASVSVVVAPTNYTIDEMSTLIAVCVGTGFPQPSITWSVNGLLLELSDRINVTEEVSEVNGVTFVQSILEVCSVTILDSGLYQCMVANQLVNDSTYFDVTVNPIGGEFCFI